MLTFVKRLSFVLVTIRCICCEYLGVPHFESSWLTLEAQSESSDLFVEHGLGSVPGLVEVLVKAVDGPNKDFIFKAIGNGERDDDFDLKYGGVIYIYNDVHVRVMAPKRANSQHVLNQGVAIYTGEYPLWLGPNTQRSFQAEVKVRCWKASGLLAPCFSKSSRFMAAGSNNTSDTYAEFSHGLDKYPALVKVRAKMTDGLDIGWYTDAQGSSLISLDKMRYKRLTGGLKYAYDDMTIRVWTSSWPYPDGAMFTRNDGWGNEFVLSGITTKGFVDIFAWCDLEIYLEESVQFGPDIIDEEFQITLPHSLSVSKMFLTSAMVEVLEGPNKGYLFEGVGSAMPNSLFLGQPCSYGGLIYAFNSTTLRLWRPDNMTGSAVCIPDTMGFGTNSQAARNGKLIFRVFQIYEKTKENIPASFMCSHFRKLGDDTAYNSIPIDIQNVTSLMLCNRACRQHRTCTTYAMYNGICKMYNTTDESLLLTHNQSVVWGLASRMMN